MCGLTQNQHSKNKSDHIRKLCVNFQVLNSDLKSARKILIRKNKHPGAQLKKKILIGCLR